MRAIKKPYFHPWKPKNFDGTLVVADSHYRGTVDPESKSGWSKEFDASLKGSDRNWTIAQNEDCISRKPGEYERLYVRLANVIAPRISPSKCFKRVAFVNAFQQVLPARDAARPWETVAGWFLANLAAVQPRRVLVAAKTVWDHLPKADETIVEHGVEFRRYGGTWATWCYHPTGSRGRFKIKDTRRRFLRLMAKTK